MKNSRTIVPWLLTLLLLAAPAVADGRGPLKIGVIATLSRLGVYQGRQAIRGLELAAQEIDGQGGIRGRRIALIIEDSQADPQRAVSALWKLINVDGVRFVIGDSWNSSTVPLVPIADSKKVLLMSPAAGLNQLSADDLFFRTMPSVSSMMESLARYAFCRLKLRRVAVLYQDNPYGLEHKTFFTRTFQGLGGVIAGAEQTAVDAGDVRTELLKLARGRPEAVLNLHASGPPIGLAVRQGRQQGLKVRWLSHFGTENADLLREHGDVIEGLVYPYPFDIETQVAGARRFVSAYHKRYAELPELISANAYDALRLVADAVEVVGENPDGVKRHLLAMPLFHGASGELRFDANGDVEKPIVIKQIEHGRFKRVDWERAGGQCEVAR